MVRQDGDQRRPKVTAGTFDAPDYVTSIKNKERPMPLIFEGYAAEKDDEPDRAIRLFLLQGGAKPSTLTSQYKRTG